MTRSNASPPPPPLHTGLRLRCPACGSGKLFAGLLSVADRCSACALDLQAQDSGDGPAFFVIIIVGFLATGLAAWVEIAYAPPPWLHMSIWIPFILITSIALLRLFKSLLIAYQYHYAIGFTPPDA